MPRKTATNDNVSVTHALLPLDNLHAHPRNYNQHPPEQITKIALSLRTFGQTRSIVVWERPDGEYWIIAGHGVTEAARSEGWQSLNANILPVDYGEARALAYLAADNELSNLSDPDMAALAQLLEESRNADIPLEAMGFSDDALEALLADLANETLDRDDTASADEELPVFKEYDETVEDDLPTEMCHECGKLCIKSVTNAKH